MPRPRSTIAGLAVLLTLASIAGAWTVLQVPWPKPPLVDTFTPEHVAFFSMYDSSAQRLAHRALLGLIAVLCVFAMVRSRAASMPSGIFAEDAVASLSKSVKRWTAFIVFALMCIYVAVKPPSYPLWFSSSGAPLLSIFDGNVGIPVERIASILRWEIEAHPYVLLTVVAFALLGAGVAAYGWRSRSSSRAHFDGSTRARQLVRRWDAIGAASLLLFVLNPLITLLLALELLALSIVYEAAIRLRPARIDLVVWSALLAYACFLTIPGLIAPLTPTLPRLEVPGGLPINYIELHYAFTLGPGDRIALGRPLFEGATPYYGVLLPIVLGWVQKTWGMFDFGAHIRIVQAFDVVFIVLAVGAYRMWQPRRAILTVIPMLLVLPWLHASHLAALHPNQSGWRFLGFPLAMIALSYVRRKAERERIAVLAGTLGVATLLNLETAIALGSGFAVYAGCRSEGLLARGAVMVIGLVIASALAAGLLLLTLGLSSDPIAFSARALAGQLYLSKTFASGYGGVPWRADPLVLWIVVHSTYVLVSTALLRARRALSHAQSFRAAVAAVILVWGGYYVNRPDPWNVWSYLYLYGFLIAPYFDPRILRFIASRLRVGVIPGPAVVFILLIMPLLVSTNAAAIIKVAQSMRSPPAEAMVSVSGIELPVPLANLLTNKARFLRELPRGSVAYVSVDSSLMPLMSLVDNALPLIDVFGEAFTEREVDRVRRSLDEARPTFVLFDDPHTELSGTADQQRFFDRIRQGLGKRYEPAPSSNGWQVWQRVAN